MKNILIGLSLLGLLLSFSGCGGTSPQVKQELKKYGISESTICRDKKMMSRNDRNKCNPFYTISEKTASKYIEKEKRKIADAKRIADAKAKKAAEAKKIADAKRIADVKKVKARMKKLGISEKTVRTTINSSMPGLWAAAYGLKEGTPITNENIDSYLKEKKKQKEAAEFERKAKIKQGKQYVCTDGYDNWVLKYNGNRITFGGVNKNINIIGQYQVNKYDNEPVSINRTKGTMSFGGNNLTCKPR